MLCYLFWFSYSFAHYSTIHLYISNTNTDELLAPTHCAFLVLKFMSHTYVSFCISACVRGLCAGRCCWSRGCGNSPATWSRYWPAVSACPQRNPKMCPAEYLSPNADSLLMTLENSDIMYFCQSHIWDSHNKILWNILLFYEIYDSYICIILH